jgi:hypothetical protein
MILHRDTFGGWRLQLDFRSAQSGYICNTAVLTCAEKDGLGLLGETFVERECLLEPSSALRGSIVLQGRPPVRVSLETRIRTVIGNPDGTLLMARYGDVASNLRQPQD